MKKRIQDMDVKGKRVLLRCDFNVPVKDGVILDDSKIIAALNTIEYLVKQGARIIIMSHFGKVKTEEDKKTNSLAPIAAHLQKLINTKVIFCKQARNLYLEAKIASMQPGEIIILENTRFEDVPNKLESGNDPQLAMYWAELADIYCLDAFGSAHRKHASTYGVAKYLPSCIGFLVQREVEALDKYVLNAAHPFTIVMGGAKVEDKVELIESLLPRCDNLLLTGGIANSCLNTLGFPVGASLCTKDPEIQGKLKQLLINYKDKIKLPMDVIVGSTHDDSFIKHINIDKVDEDQAIYDIGMKTVNQFKEIIDNSATIFVNGTAGKYEDIRFATGTRELLTNIANSKAVKVVGGGDGVSAVKHFNLGEKFNFLSTGGGATLEYIIQGGLPAIDNINEA
ncbi:MAG: phosphoglycerate kinase [Bacilli bacterium]|nr:phosphoglycerate kinase [Bacilli bacterium]